MQINGIELSPEINLYTDGLLIFNKDARTVQRKRKVFSTNNTGITEWPHAKQ